MNTKESEIRLIINQIIRESLETRKKFLADLLDIADNKRSNLQDKYFKSLTSGEESISSKAGKIYKKLFNKHADHKFLNSLDMLHVSNTEDFRISRPVLNKDELSCVLFNDINKKNKFILKGLKGNLKTGLDKFDMEYTFPLVIELKGYVTYCEAKGLNTGYRQGWDNLEKRTQRPSVEIDMSPKRIKRNQQYYIDEYGEEEGMRQWEEWRDEEYSTQSDKHKKWSKQYSSGYNKSPKTPSMVPYQWEINRKLAGEKIDHEILKKLILDKEDFDYWENKLVGKYPNEALVDNWRIKTIYIPNIQDKELLKEIISQVKEMQHAVGSFEIKIGLK